MSRSICSSVTPLAASCRAVFATDVLKVLRLTRRGWRKDVVDFPPFAPLPPPPRHVDHEVRVARRETERHRDVSGSLFRAPDQPAKEIARRENREAQSRFEPRAGHEVLSVEGEQEVDAGPRSRGEHVGIL